MYPSQDQDIIYSDNNKVCSLVRVCLKQPNPQSSRPTLTIYSQEKNYTLVMLLTMHVVNSNGECASPHYDNTVQPRLSRFLDYPDLFLCSKIFMNINLLYFVSTAKLSSFKLCTMRTEFIALLSTNLYTFCTLTDRVHFTEL